MIVRQVQNAFDLLDFFATRGNAATISEIADHFGWPRSSTFNMVETLLAAGMLHEPKHKGGYFPTLGLLTLGQRLTRHDALDASMHELVAQLADDSGETAVLAGFSGMSAVFLSTRESSHAIRYFAEIGQQVPLYATSVGRALLSCLPDNLLDRILDRTDFTRHAPDTLVGADAVRQEIADSRGRGYFVNTNGYVPGLTGLALPVATGASDLALLVAGPADRLAGREEKLVAMMRSAAAHLAGAE